MIAASRCSEFGGFGLTAFGNVGNKGKIILQIALTIRNIVNQNLNRNQVLSLRHSFW